jgi:hypothetical protein
MNSLFHVLNLQSQKNKKKYSGHRVLLFLDLQHQKKTQYTIMEPSRFMESVNKLAKDGANTTIISLV